VVVYRNRTASEVRDIYRVVYDLEQERWGEPAALSTEEWNIAGCPVNGPQLAAFGQTVIATWFSAADNRPRSYIAVSQDSGLTFDTAQTLDDGASMGRVGIVVNRDGVALLTWIAATDGRAMVYGRMWQASGLGDTFEIGVIDASRGSGFPRPAAAGGNFLLAWTELEEGTQAGVRTVLVSPRR
jgi:hypothetical protein